MKAGIFAKLSALMGYIIVIVVVSRPPKHIFNTIHTFLFKWHGLFLSNNHDYLSFVSWTNVMQMVQEMEGIGTGFPTLALIGIFFR